MEYECTFYYQTALARQVSDWLSYIMGERKEIRTVLTYRLTTEKALTDDEIEALKAHPPEGVHRVEIRQVI